MFSKILFLVSLAFIVIPLTSLTAMPAFNVLLNNQKKYQSYLKLDGNRRNWTLIASRYDLPPERILPPSAILMPTNGKVSIRLLNETSANITYEAIGNTNQRLLLGKSSVILQDLKTPLSITFKRQDGGLLMVNPKANSEPGTLSVTFTETTDLGIDKSAMDIQNTGAVFLN